METPDFERDALIDETALDFEWIQQPSLAKKYANFLVYMESLVRQADEKVKVVRSELIMKAMLHPEEAFGKAMNSVSDTKLEAYYRTHKKYKKAKEKLGKLIEEKSYAEYAYKEIAFTRKTELEQLVKLHGQNYFSAPNIPKDITVTVKEKTKERSLNKKRKIVSNKKKNK